MATLDTELRTYTENLHGLLDKQGKFVLIKGTQVVDTYDSYEDALKAGYAKFQLEPFLVKKISAAEQVSFFTRDMGTACPA